MKQSAIEWFYKRILSKDIEEVFEQAKGMHKQEIIDAYNKGFEKSAEGWNGEYGIKDFKNLSDEIESEKYYQETFEK